MTVKGQIGLLTTKKKRHKVIFTYVKSIPKHKIKSKW